MLTTLDKFGRILIPKKIREHLGITSNSSLNVIEDGDRVVIERIKEEEPVIEKEGILVFTGKLSGDLQNLINTDRYRRANKLLFPGE
ncbi:MAG: AbrB/MazE/SpoVT family DNA-binding domain-containing protein [Calditrichaceae bacterium]|nr:AbrB/MazE/SpoVT family DNA-binding domain-containing protein [Calditrichaceae bacterium]RQV96684.1 MAG: AbrB/MazE/SpoVT family DNA-binding domain-containing protein [Calditrichota bacterium]